jgi:DnaD/phage-associated family protein
MNYMRELNAFRDWAMINRPSTGGVALWNMLMSVNNMTGWKTWFTVPNQMLQLLTGLSRQGIESTRNSLLQYGLIEYKKGRSNQAGSYRMISLLGDNFPECQNLGTGVGTTLGTDVGTSTGTLLGTGVGIPVAHSYTRLDEKKDDDNTRESEDLSLLKQIEKNYRPISPADMQFFTRWQEDFPDDVILDCVRRAFENSAFSQKYMDTIFQRWMQAGVKTMEDVGRLDAAWEKRKGIPKPKEPDYPSAQIAWEEVVDKLLVKKQQGIVWSHDVVARAVKNVGYLRLINTADYIALMPVFIAEYNAIVGGG